MNLMERWQGMNRTTRVVVLGVAAVAILGCCLVFSGYSYVNNIWNEGVAKETQLSAQYQDNQNYLSGYISGFYEQVSVAEAAKESLNEILLDAVKGRYDDGGFAVGSPMFAAVVEAYPEAGVEELMTNWGKIQDYISAGRAGYRETQSKLLDMLRAYDTWRQRGLIRRQIVRMVGFPSENLEARIGDQVWTGEMARQKMLTIVLIPEAKAAYESGEMDPLSVDPEE